MIMKITKAKISKYFTETFAGVVGGSIFGMLGLIPGMNYPSICPKIIDTIFGTQGYESCGSFTALIGILIGIIITIFAIRKLKQSNKVKNIISIVLLIVIPYLLVIIGMGIEDILVVPPVILIFVLLSIIPSLIITFLMNWKTFFPKK
jgi:hypothetical protein